MKKFAVLFAALLQCFLAYSQEAESASGESSTQLLVIPRLDVTPDDLGDSALYSLFEGSFGDSPLSFSVANVWLSTEPASLYSNTFRSDELNWLNWAYINYNAGGFDFTLGKDCMSIGTFEIDAYDFDSYSLLSSSFWNELQVYQWGAKIGYSLPEELASFSLQASTSPFGEKPFSSGLFAYTARADAFLGANSLMLSASMMETGASLYWLVALGDSFELGDFTIGIDAYNASFGKISFSDKSAMPQLALAPSLKYDFGGKVTAMAKCIYENGPLGKSFTRGAAVEYFPLNSGRDLRLHAVISRYTAGGEGYFTGMLGVTYFFNLL